MAKFGIDISKWQGDFDVTEARNEGVEFAIIKCGGGDNSLYGDKMFETNANKCIENGVPFGVYFYGNASTIKEAEDEANYCLFLIEDYEFDLPVFYDVEGDMLNTDGDTLTGIVKTFCNTIKHNGYKVGIYASESVFNNKLNDDELSNFYHWVAKWSTNEPNLNSGNDVDIWQFGGTTNPLRENTIAGVVCDQDYCYMEIDTPAPSPTPDPEPSGDKTVYDIACEVMNGDWGNDPQRSEALSEAGYDPQEVQNLINGWYEVADEVIAGDWGNDPERSQALYEQGYPSEIIRAIVNSLLR